MVDEHVPVLAERVATLLGPSLQAPGSVLVDCTLGLGGHTTLMLTMYPNLRVIGIDRDPTALLMATERVAAAGFSERFDAAHAVYDEIGSVLSERGISSAQAILFDLGVSSMQLDRTERGFAYAVDAPLDMRMNPTTGITAADVLNTYAPGDIVRLLREYGDEKFATRIVSEVVKRRREEPWTTSGPLVELIRAAIPAAARRTGGHPAKRTFQALRIEVNDELGALRRAIPAAVTALAVGGRLAVISFQSLEDRIVKKLLAPQTQSSAPLDLPMDLPEFAPHLTWITRGSEAPTDDEVLANSRAASAKIRAVERIRASV
ncbi:16S rRNA (cytosine(1402)-N(4))-methyltransferase RsmH [Nakamurella antarctica]|uniref:Ribosomal RNA small subunit methyltransferase H n=1 Tax=Nakamurella antarctica TaxID=1902245 RepID=A0A3G8ZJY5_9ACTN|nr:16S rRNA (cytosine(1402)-N(4))-methyltransferase RsmH [Nakamurella antarctica]AZI57662.1 16S rRNA (cytosine(1402)-N(4))-methyltransferase RsmH [Nakamurella antarctica]